MIFSIVGARPNFMKMAPIVNELNGRNVAQTLVHTGQHYDSRMSDVFFDVLGMPVPEYNLRVGSGSHAEQTARIMMRFEKLCINHSPALVIVAGDVNSTLACALVASKLSIPVAHVESGLRSFDRRMPEEINRVLTDHLCDLLFVTEQSGIENLRREGIDERKIHFVGNTMIDSLLAYRDAALAQQPWREFDLEPGSYALVTLHRPSNVDHLEQASHLAAALETIAENMPVLFPIHPRTLARNPDLWFSASHIRLIDPLDYLTFLGLMAQARVVITDSGGIQEETTALGVKCITVRENTERPVTLTQGTNHLVPPIETEKIVSLALDSHHPVETQCPPQWDGKAAIRIVDVIVDYLNPFCEV